MANVVVNVFGRTNTERLKRLENLGNDTHELSSRYAQQLARYLRSTLPRSKRRSVSTPRVSAQVFIRPIGNGLFSVGVKGDVAKFIIQGTKRHFIRAGNSSRFTSQGVSRLDKQMDRILRKRVQDARVRQNKGHGDPYRLATAYENAVEALDQHRVNVSGKSPESMLFFPWGRARSGFFVGPFVDHPGIQHPVPYVDMARNALAGSFGRELRALLEGRGA